MPAIRSATASLAMPQNQRLIWAPIREAILNILGPTGTIVPMGDTQHEAADRTTVTSVGDLQAVFTYAPGAVTAFATPPSALGPAYVPVITLNAINEELTTPDADYWSRGNAVNDFAFSMGAWVRVTSSAANKPLFVKGGQGTAGGEWEFIVTGADKLMLGLRDDSVAKVPDRTSNAVITTGAWKFLACTYDGSGGALAANGITLYQDGVAIPSTATNDAAYVAMENGTALTEIGRRPNGPLFFNGQIAGGPLGVFYVQAGLTADQLLRIFQLGRTAIDV